MDDRYEPTTGTPGGTTAWNLDVARSQPGIIGPISSASTSRRRTAESARSTRPRDEAGRSLLVVDTGPWIFGKKVVLPAGIVDRVDLDGETVYVNRTKDEIKNAPEFDSDTHLEDDEYNDRLGSYYDRTRALAQARVRRSPAVQPPPL